FLRADVQPAVCVFLDLVGQAPNRFLRRLTVVAGLPVLEHAPTVADHARHRAARRQKMSIPERVAGDDDVRRDLRVLSGSLDEAEELWSVDHLDLLDRLL